MFIPDPLAILVTNQCNLAKCPFCLTSSTKRKNSKELTIQEWVDFLSIFDRVGDVRVTGGESLCNNVYQKTHAIIDYLYPKARKIQLNTNGTTKNWGFEKYKDKLIIQTSLDGGKNFHDSLRGKGTFEKTVQFIKKRRKEGYEIYFVCVALSKDLHEVYKVAKISEKLGVPVKIHLPMDSGRYKNSKFGFIDTKDKEEFGHLLQERFQSHPLVELRLAREEHSTCILNEFDPNGRSLLAIDECGNIIPCPFLKSVVLGTVFDFNLDQVKKNMVDKVLTTGSYCQKYE